MVSVLLRTGTLSMRHALAYLASIAVGGAAIFFVPNLWVWLLVVFGTLAAVMPSQ